MSAQSTEASPTHTAHIPTLREVSLDQWAMFVAVCEAGSTHGAGRMLGRSHSAISQAVRGLQDTLGAALLEKCGRRLVPTASGRVVVQHASRLLASAAQVEAVATALSAGWAAEVQLAVDGVVPRAWVRDILAAFAPDSRGSRVRVHHVLQNGAADAALDAAFDVVLTATLPDGTAPCPVGALEFVPVAAAGHPVTDAGLGPHALERYTQVVLADTAAAHRHDEHGWLRAPYRWTVPDLGTAVAMLQGTTAFAVLPTAAVADALAAGTLVRLAAHGLTLPVHAVRPRGDASGPAADALWRAVQAARGAQPGAPQPPRGG